MARSLPRRTPVKLEKSLSSRDTSPANAKREAEHHQQVGLTLQSAMETPYPLTFIHIGGQVLDEAGHRSRESGTGTGNDDGTGTGTGFSANGGCVRRGHPGLQRHQTRIGRIGQLQGIHSDIKLNVIITYYTDDLTIVPAPASPPHPALSALTTAPLPIPPMPVPTLVLTPIIFSIGRRNIAVVQRKRVVSFLWWLSGPSVGLWIVNVVMALPWTR